MLEPHGSRYGGPVEFSLPALRVVVEVARAGSFTAAAHRLGYSQSAVSRQVAAAEQAAGAALFERQARGVRPTAAGEVLVRHATRVLDDIAGATEELAGLRGRLAGRLAVGGYPTAMAVLLPRALARVAAAHPGLDVHLVEASTAAQIKALRHRRLDVAVVATGDGLPAYDLDGLPCIELQSGAGSGVAVAESHALAARSWVDVAELAAQPWIVGPAGGPPEFGAWHGIEEPVVAFVVRDWVTRLGLAAAGLGVVLVPAVAAAMVPQGVRWIPIRSGVIAQRRTAWAVTQPSSGPAAAAMVEALVEEVRTLAVHARQG